MKHDKLLTLGITHYNEPESVIEPLLDSIKCQRGVDFNDIDVIIVNDGNGINDNDGSTLLSEEFLDRYRETFDICYVATDKGTISSARNKALDLANGRFIQFIDCDDVFSSMQALWFDIMQIKNYENAPFDMLIGNFLEETKNPETGEIIYIDRPVNQNFVHGKLFRVDYLKSNNIRFADHLSIHEEPAMISVAMAMTTPDRILYNQNPTFTWCWNDNSVCRRDPLYLLKTFNNLIDTVYHLINQYKSRGKDDLVTEQIVFMFNEAYYTLACKDWKHINNSEYRKDVEEYFKAFYDKYKDVWEKADEQMKLQIGNQVRQNKIMEGKLEMEDITMKDFLHKFE